MMHANDGTYKHVKCVTCNARIKGKGRHCPNPTAIKHHFSIYGDVDIHIRDEDIICTNCYNAHLQILHESNETSTDAELKALLQHSVLSGKKHADHIAQALNEVLTNVGSVLLKDLAVLLPEVYDFFVNQAVMRASQLGLSQSESHVKQDMPKRCVLSCLLGFFGKHIEYKCKQRSCGVLINRRGADLTVCLSKTLQLLQETDRSILKNMEPTVPQSADKEMSEMDTLCSKMNKKVHEQIKVITAADAASPYDISKFDADATISNIDPMLWRMIVFLTRTVTERRKQTPPSKINTQCKLQCLYCLCVMFFATNRCCSIPLHVLLTDLIDSQGGSHELIMGYGQKCGSE